MDVKDYISSGILESYVMGLTSPWETLQVEAMAAKHPEVKQEIAAIEKTLFSLSQSTAVTPHAELKGKIFSAVTGEPIPKVIEINRGKFRNSTVLKWAVAASVTLLLGSAVLNYYLYDRLNKADAHLAHLSNEHSTLQNNYTAVKTNLENTSEELRIYEDPNFRMICLMGAATDTMGSLAHVYWDTINKTVFLEVNNLPAAPDTMQYQLWAIENGIPKNAGLIGKLDSPVQKMELIPNAQAFAISMERKGSAALLPEGKIYVTGNI